MSNTNQLNQSTEETVDWSTFYKDLEEKGHVPNASKAFITKNNAIFRGMYLNFADIKEQIRTSGVTPLMTTIYADVLVIPPFTNWLLESSALIIFARRIEIQESSNIMLNYEHTSTAQFVLYATEMIGTLTVSAVKKSDEAPTIFNITQDTLKPGIRVSNQNNTPACQSISLKQGIGFQIADDMLLYLNNSFIFGSLLYDQNATLAISIFLWVKGWAAQSSDMAELFYRSSSIATLLTSQVNAEKNGAKFVPYLTSDIYVNLSDKFASAAAKYESDYMTLSTQVVLTEQNIVMAKTMVANTDSEIEYVNALLTQANENYANAEMAARKAQSNFTKQERATNMIAIDFEQIGIPDYEREAILKGIVDLVKALVTFGGAIALMAVGDEAAAPAAAEGAVAGVEAVASAAQTGAEVAKLADDLAKTMKELKKLVEALQKVYELSKAIKEVADNISSAQDQMSVIQEMKDTTDGADLSATDGWAIFKIQADNSMANAVELGIGYAKSYQEALDILVIYGQSLSAAQLAVIKAGQDVATITFQLHYTEEKKANLQKLVDDLEVGEAPLLIMMQQFYQKYLDSKSSLFSALKSYEGSYFYWALKQSSVQPKIIDPVDDLNAGIQDITKIAMDQATALEQFNPPPQTMSNMLFEITDEETLSSLQTTGIASWILPLEDKEFSGLDRVRLDNIRIWLEGTSFEGNDESVYITLTNTGNYLDRYKNDNYQFNSKLLTRTFKYRVSKGNTGASWQFDNGTYGIVQIDGAVDQEVAYAYFRPTPFSEWTISLRSYNSTLDYSKVSKITMYFAGSAIGTSESSKRRLVTKHAANGTISK